MSCRWIRPPASCCRLPLASQPPASRLHALHPLPLHLSALPSHRAASRRPKPYLHILHSPSLPFLPSPLSRHLSPISCHHAHCHLPPSRIHPPASHLQTLHPQSLSSLPHYPTKLLPLLSFSPLCPPSPLTSYLPLLPPASLPSIPLFSLSSFSSLPLPLSRRLSPPPHHRAHYSPLHPSSHRTRSVVLLPAAYLYPLGSPSCLSLSSLPNDLLPLPSPRHYVHRCLSPPAAQDMSSSLPLLPPASSNPSSHRSPPYLHHSSLPSIKPLPLPSLSPPCPLPPPIEPLPLPSLSLSCPPPPPIISNPPLSPPYPPSPSSPSQLSHR